MGPVTGGQLVLWDSRIYRTHSAVQRPQRPTKLSSFAVYPLKNFLHQKTVGTQRASFDFQAYGSGGAS